jgi:anti-sigma factor RsiW
VLRDLDGLDGETVAALLGLERLTAFVDGDLQPGEADRIRAHVRDCDWCERFGGEFAATLAQFRLELAEAVPLDPDAARRLRQHLRSVQP